MKECIVLKIINKPEEVKLNLDHATIKYWAVEVLMDFEDGVRESIVTYETEDKANQLEIGDVFLR